MGPLTGTLIKCARCDNSASRKLEDGTDGCHECWAKEKGVVLPKSKGRPVRCPKCGNVLMTRFRGGKVNIGNMSLQGDTATLDCECGYKKRVKNPFGGRRNRDEAARQTVMRESRKKKGSGP